MVTILMFSMERSSAQSVCPGVHSWIVLVSLRRINGSYQGGGSVSIVLISIDVSIQVFSVELSSIRGVSSIVHPVRNTPKTKKSILFF